MIDNRIQARLETLDRMEKAPDVVDRDTALTSIAISLRRIADILERPALLAAMKEELMQNMHSMKIRASREQFK